jgi:malate permease and related proteins
MLHLDSLAKVLPVLLVIGLGALLRRARLLGGEAAAELKGLVVNLTLPALLFLAFARLDAEVRYLGLVAAVFLACLAGLLLGRLLHPLTGIRARSFPMLLTGFEAGMMGYALSASVYGQESLRRFALVDLGQVLFVFAVLVPALQRSSGGAPPLRERLRGFARSPVVLAIAGGLLAGQAGLLRALEAAPGASGLVEAVAMVGAMTTPLVALLLGHDLRLELRGMARPALAVGLRLLLWIPAGLAIAELVVRRWLGLDRGYVAALMLLVVLPPPFVIPLFLPAQERGEVDFTVRTLALSTVVSLAAVTAVALLFPA